MNHNSTQSDDALVPPPDEGGKDDAGVPPDGKAITVSGVTFRADQVKSATVTIDGRDITIGERKSDARIGYR